MKRVFHLPGRTGTRRDVEREIELHIELSAREFEAQGMSGEAARQAAVEAFGDRAEIASEVGTIRRTTLSRRARHAWLDELRQDFVIGARVLRRAPSFAVVALLTLTIGIGANTAIFGVLRSVLMRPLPYPHSEQLVQVWSDHRALGREQPEWLTPPDFVDWRDRNTTFSSMAAYQGWAPDLTGNGDPESLTGLLVSGNYFSVLGTTPVMGRLFTMSDDDANAERVVVLSNSFWQRRFGGDPSIVGRHLMLSGVEWTVVGVLPATFHAPLQAAARDLFAPTRRPASSGCGRGCVVLRVIGRMKPGITPAIAQADLARIASGIAREYPATNAKVGAWLVPLHEQITGSEKAGLLSISMAVGLVLLIGCLNLANLLLVRSAARSREIGVRAALGAGRWRVIRQLLTENALLAAMGGAFGLAAGVAGTRALAVLVPASVREVQQIHADTVVILFAVGITVLSALIFGLLPAMRAVRPGLMATLRSGSRETGRNAGALRSTLVVTQLSFAVVLLVSAGLLLRSFLAMQHVEMGFRTNGVYLTAVRFPASRYPDGKQAFAKIDELLGRLRANPSVRSAEATDLPPLSGGGDQDIGAIPVGSTPVRGQPASIWYRTITPGYFTAMRMRIVAGRSFTDDDRAGLPAVGVLNEEAARRFFPGQNAIGRVLATGESADALRITVVGIVGADHHDGPNQPLKSEVFVALKQLPSRGVTLVLEPRGDVASLSAAARQAIHDVDPLVPVPALEPLEQRVGDSIALPRLYATLVALFAAAAMLLAALGVYGVISYGVAQRQREIGVRLALGASPSGIARMILSEGSRLAFVGLAVGIAGAVALGQLLSKLLFGVTPYDAVTLTAVPLILAAVTVVASWMPARRAMRLDPVIAIRDE